MNHHLVNYAILESIYANEKGDVFDHCIVFFIETLYNNELIKDLNIEDAQEIFLKYLNFELPLSVIRIILNRGKKKFKFFSQKDGRYFPDKYKIEEKAQQITEIKGNVQRETKKLLESFILYSKNEFNIELQLNSAEEIISNYLSSYQIEIIDYFSTSKGIEVKGRSSKNNDFLLSSFLKNIHNKEPELFKYFLTYVRGIIVKNYIVSNQIMGNQTSLNNVTIYLDTPVIMSLLGFNGESKKTVINEMINLCSKSKIKLRVFECTKIEIENIIKAWIIDLENGNLARFRDSTLQLLKQKGWDHIYLKNFLSRLSSSLSKHNINIVAPFQRNEKYQIDIIGLEDHIKRDTEKDYLSVTHDVECVENTVQLRRYRRSMTLNDNAHIFVTTNNFLISSVNKYFTDEFDKDSVPVICNDIWITNIAWMINPKIFPDWPEHLVISNCQSIIYDDDVFWKDFINRFRTLKDEGAISEEDYYLVRHESILKSSLKLLTVTDGMSYNDEHIFDLVEKTKNKILDKKNVEISKKDEIIEAYRNKLNIYCRNFSFFVKYLIEVMIVVFLWLLSYLPTRGTKYENWSHLSIVVGIVINYFGFSVKNLGIIVQQKTAGFLYDKLKRIIEKE